MSDIIENSPEQNKPTEISDLQKLIGEKLLAGKKSLFEAGQELVRALEIDKNAIRNINDRFPQIGIGYLMFIWKIGMKQIHPGTIDIEDAKVQRLVQKLPYLCQEKALAQPIEVLLADGQVLNMSVFKFNGIIAKQVLGRGKIDDLAAQRAYQESEKLRQQSKALPKIDSEFKIVNKNCVEFYGPCKLTRSAVMRILDSMAG